MLESLLTSQMNSGEITILSGLATIGVSFILGLIVSFTYMKTHKKGIYSQNFALTLIIVPTVISIIILVVGSNVATAFSLLGAFSIIRFRSAPGDPKDIAYVLFTMAAGLACGVGFYGYAFLFTILLCALMFVLNKLNYGAKKKQSLLLKITVPEDLDFKEAFVEPLTKYTTFYEMKKVRTTDLGSLFEVNYVIDLKDKVDEKTFLDDLRCRNGNLNIILTMEPERAEY